MSDKVKIEFTDDGTLVLDVCDLDEALKEKLLSRGLVAVDGNRLSVLQLGPYQWAAGKPAPDVNCYGCDFGGGGGGGFRGPLVECACSPLARSRSILERASKVLLEQAKELKDLDH